MAMRLAICALLLLLLAAGRQPSPGRLQIEVVDGASRTVPCRIHVADAAGQPAAAPGQVAWRDHFVCEGKVELRLPPGTYRYEVERGPEWETARGNVALEASGSQTARARLDRVADLRRDGWYCGDLHVHRAPAEMSLHLRAEDLNVAPSITWWNKQNRWANERIPPPQQLLQEPERGRYTHLMGGEDERQGGAVLFFHLREPLPITGGSPEHPSAVRLIAAARLGNPECWIDIEKPFWWDVPLWVATGQVDSIGIAHNHMHRSGVMDAEAWGRARDRERFPPPHGNGLWSQEIYYHLLNSGLRIPPSAGSASGVLPNPVGHNRVYVHLEGGMDHAAWWKGLKAGRAFVTNGPLLTCRADGKLPGHRFRGRAGERLTLSLSLSLAGKDRVPRLEVIQDGRVASVIETGGRSSGRFTGRVAFTESGWFLVRAIADNPRSFRFASTAPFYVEIGEPARRIRRASVRFFLDWLAERRQRVAAALTDADQRREVLADHDAARRFWEERLRRAEAT